jgi:hypothetical protein
MEDRCITCRLCSSHYRQISHAYSSPLQQRELKTGGEHVVFVLLITGRLASLCHAYSSLLQQRESKTGLEHVVFDSHFIKLYIFFAFAALDYVIQAWLVRLLPLIGQGSRPLLLIGLWNLKILR